jgi:hypothetical protein
MPYPKTVSEIRHVSCSSVALADKEQHAKHAADSTKQVLICLAVTYAVESPPFKSFITFLNSLVWSGLVWSGLVWSGLVCFAHLNV